jgi:hypothetical protein
MDIKDLEKNERLLRLIVEKLFIFSEVDSRFEGVDSSIGNFRCPFSPGKSQKSAKMYFDNEKNIFIIHSFKKNRNYSVYDYIKKVLEQNPYNYLIKYKNKNEILEIIKNFEKGYIDIENNLRERKINYINHVFQSTDNIIDYIEKLYDSKLEKKEEVF